MPRFSTFCMLVLCVVLYKTEVVQADTSRCYPAFSDTIDVKHMPFGLPSVLDTTKAITSSQELAKRLFGRVEETSSLPASLSQTPLAACCTPDATPLARWDFESATPGDPPDIPPSQSSSCATIGLFTGDIANSRFKDGKAAEGIQSICTHHWKNTSYKEPNAGLDRYIRLTVKFPIGKCGTISGLSFIHQTPVNGSNSDKASFPNNYARKFAVSVLRNGTKIWEQKDLATTRAWQTSTFNWSGVSFEADGSNQVLYEIFLQAYDPFNSGGDKPTYLWEFDDVRILGCCTNPPPPSCSLNSVETQTTCVSSGNTATDRFTVQAKVTGSNTGATYNVSGGITDSGKLYGSFVPIGSGSGYLISGGPLSFTVTDASNPSCSKNATVFPPAPCSPACVTPSFNASASSTTCSGTTMNTDGRLSISGVSNGTKVGYSLGSTYTGPDFSSATSVSGSSATLVSNLSNPSSPQTYTIRVFNAATSCYLDKQVILNPTPACTVPCIKPAYTASGENATCSGGSANTDGKLVVSGVTNGDRVGYSTGSSYTGSGYSSASSIPGGGVLVSSLPNPSTTQTYTIRIFNGGDTCYEDKQVLLSRTNCVTPCTKPTFAGAAYSSTCSGSTANADGRIEALGISNGNRIGYSLGTSYSGPAYASANTVSGSTQTLLSGIVNPGSIQYYTIRVFNNDETCYDDRTVGLSPVTCSPGCTLPTFSTNTEQVTCSGATPNTDGQLRISGVSNGDRVSYSVGSSYTGGGYAGANSIPGSGILSSSLSNPSSTQYYTVRVFNGGDACYADKQAILNPKSCATPCSINFSAYATSPTCSGGSANANGSITITNVSGGGVSYAYLQGAGAQPSFGSAFPINNPGSQVIVANLPNPGTTTYYTVRVFNTDGSCYSDVPVALNSVSCTQPCVPPTFTGSSTQVTCTPGGTANADGKLIISNISGGDKVGYSNGTVYAGNAYSSANALPGTGELASTLPNPLFTSYYTIRLFNGSNTCYTDQIVPLNNRDCTPPPPPCTTPSFTLTPTNATCHPNGGANTDGKLTITGVTNGDKVSYAPGSFFAGANYAGATAIPSTGELTTTLSNPASNQAYTVRVYNGADTCFLDKTGSLSHTDCPPVCVKPNYNAVAQQASCLSGSPQNDAQLQLYNFANGDKVGFSTGSTYTGPNYASASTMSGTGIITSSLPNPASDTPYTIRVFNGRDGCYEDRTITLGPKTCVIPCTYPTFTLTGQEATCSTGIAQSDAKLLISGVTGGDKVGYAVGTTYTGPNYTTASSIPVNNILLDNISNPVASGTGHYTVRVFNGRDDCYFDKEVVINPKSCGACDLVHCTEISAADQGDSDSTPNDGLAGQDDMACTVVTRACTNTPCIPPNFEASTVSATCAAGIANADGKLVISEVTNADRVYYLEGTDYVGGRPYATATPIPAASLPPNTNPFTVVSTLENPPAPFIYTIRAYNGSDSCYTDRFAILDNTLCTPNCTVPNFSLTAKKATCNLDGTAKSDAAIMAVQYTNASAFGMSVGGASYAGPDYNNAGGIAMSGVLDNALPNPSSPTTYHVRFFNASNICYADQKVTLEPQTCTPTCVQPTFLTTATTITCAANGTPNADAKIAISNVQNGTKVGYSTGLVYTGPNFSSANPLPLDGVIVSGLTNPSVPQIYAIRVYNDRDSCYAESFEVLPTFTCTPDADLSLTKIADKSTAEVGGTIQYTLTIANAGPGNAGDIMVRDRLPSNTIYQSDTGNGAYDPLQGLWRVGTLNSGQSKSIQITVKVVSNN